MTSDESFGKKEHLLKSRDFIKVYKKGSSRRGGGTVLYYLPNMLGHSRLGFSLSSRNIKKATARNRIRRVFKEAYRKKKNIFKTGVDCIISVKKAPAAPLSYEQAQALLLRLAGEARLLR